MDLAVVGGGVQAVALGSSLVRAAIPRAKDFGIIAAQPLLAQWLKGMSYQGLRELRTPAREHIDPRDATHDLPRFVRERSGGGASPESDIAAKPADVSLLNAHAARVVQDFGLEARRVSGRVTSLAREGKGFRLELSSVDGPKAIKAARVVVAIGL